MLNLREFKAKYGIKVVDRVSCLELYPIDDNRSQITVYKPRVNYFRRKEVELSRINWCAIGTTDTETTLKFAKGLEAVAVEAKRYNDLLVQMPWYETDESGLSHPVGKIVDMLCGWLNEQGDLSDRDKVLEYVTTCPVDDLHYLDQLLFMENIDDDDDLEIEINEELTDLLWRGRSSDNKSLYHDFLYPEKKHDEVDSYVRDKFKSFRGEKA